MNMHACLITSLRSICTVYMQFILKCLYTYITPSAVMGVVHSEYSVYSEMKKNGLARLSKVVRTVEVSEHQRT